MQIYDPYTQKTYTQKTSKILRFLYNTIIGRIILKILTIPLFSKIYFLGFFLFPYNYNFIIYSFFFSFCCGNYIGRPSRCMLFFFVVRPCKAFFRCYSIRILNKAQTGLTGHSKAVYNAIVRRIQYRHDIGRWYSS